MGRDYAQTAPAGQGLWAEWWGEGPGQCQGAMAWPAIRLESLPEDVARHEAPRRPEFVRVRRAIVWPQKERRRKWAPGMSGSGRKLEAGADRVELTFLQLIGVYRSDGSSGIGRVAAVADGPFGRLPIIHCRVDLLRNAA